VRVEWGTRPLLETREKWRTLGTGKSWMIPDC
jgi:hypothetical protein